MVVHDRVLGFDFGLARIGVASGQFITRTASPVATIAAVQGEPNWDEVKKLVSSWRPSILLVGLPYHSDGSEAPMTALARAFAQKLATHTGLPLELVDERLSTREVRSVLQEDLQRKRAQFAKVDALAACLIIESWMNK